MKIVILKSISLPAGRVQGLNSKRLKIGEMHDLPSDLANSFVKRKLARKATSKDSKTPPEDSKAPAEGGAEGAEGEGGDGTSTGETD